jgi:formylglycine-generating enzyme required for sulfatase activity
MASPKEFPHFVPAFSALGAARLCAIADAAAVDLGASREPKELATRLLARIKAPADVARFLEPSAVDLMGAALNLGRREDWKPRLSAEEIAKLPDYLRPSYARDVYQLFQHRVTMPRAAVREVTTASSHAKDWPELATRGAWARADRAALARVLSDALGFEPAEPTREGFARVVDPKLALTYVALVGGSFQMGISAKEKRALNKRAKALGAEAAEHAKWIAKEASPQREVTVAPLLLGERLLSATQASTLGLRSDGDPVRVDAEDAAELVRLGGRRLASEAEWEYVARWSDRSWLQGDEDPTAWIKHPDDDAPLGIRGLAWGEWVDDGWHDTFKGAPLDGAPWQPRVRPETVRSGALALWPWQNPGEELLLHVAARDRSTGVHAVRFAIDLPRRR